ncbi:MAG TPA: methyltransferase domain-containing protein [Steroidobacter sp.]|nr:methyltransferase domain-containing protein [Steroidobacter sp.]
MQAVAATPRGGLLGDTPSRDYSQKLSLFNRFAEPELRRIIASLQLRRGDHVVDCGCGTGEVLGWLAHEIGPDGIAVGLDLAAAHVRRARAIAPSQSLLLQADVSKPPLQAGSFDLAWCVNTINHLRDPLMGVKTLAALLRSQGRLVVGQSSFLPDMIFAWDAQLERRVDEAVRRYYVERYGIEDLKLTGIRALVGMLRSAGLSDVATQTIMIERISPLSCADIDYLLQAVFLGTWGQRLRPYLCAEDYDEVARLCDPEDPGFALRRADFHYLQSFTVVTGTLPS